MATWGRGAPMTRGTMHRQHAIDASFDDTYEYDSGAMVRCVDRAKYLSRAQAVLLPPVSAARARARARQHPGRTHTQSTSSRMAIAADADRRSAPLSTLLPRTAWAADHNPGGEEGAPRGGAVEVDAEGLPIQLSTGMLQALQHVVEHKRRTLADLHSALGITNGEAI